jgi:hypothetical protein
MINQLLSRRRPLCKTVKPDSRNVRRLLCIGVLVSSFLAVSHAAQNKPGAEGRVGTALKATAFFSCSKGD